MRRRSSLEFDSKGWSSANSSFSDLIQQRWDPTKQTSGLPSAHNLLVCSHSRSNLLRSRADPHYWALAVAPPPYEDATTSYPATSSHQLNAQATPFIPTAFIPQQQSQPLSCPHSHSHSHAHLPPPRRTFTPLGPTPYHTLPPPVSYEREHAIHLADRRARRRFFSALCWGILLYLAISAAVTVGMQNQRELKKGAESAWMGIKRWIRQLERNWDPERLNGGRGVSCSSYGSCRSVCANTLYTTADPYLPLRRRQLPHRHSCPPLLRRAERRGRPVGA